MNEGHSTNCATVLLLIGVKSTGTIFCQNIKKVKWQKLSTENNE